MSLAFPLSPYPLIQYLQSWPPEGLSVLLLVSCGGIICLMARLFGALGLTIYTAIAVIIANLQVQIATFFSFSQKPVALGTIVFSSTFIVTSFLTERYGKAEAQKAVWLSFMSVIILTFFMLITLGFSPAYGFQNAHTAIQLLFTPAPALIMASLIAYVVSQYTEIWVFSGLSWVTHGKLLWLRSFVGPLVGAFFDNLLFSILAWIVFARHPLSWETVFFTYALGTYGLRVGVAILAVPFMYILRYSVR